MKAPTHKWRHGLWLVIFLFSLLCEGQNAKSQWWKDTVWTKETDQGNGFYMLKFSKNDSIIVGNGYEMDLFFDAKTGNEIKRIKGTHEVFFINNDRNFIRLRQDRSKFEIFDTKSFTVIDSLESDKITITGDYDVSSDEKYIVATIPSGIRIFDLVNKRILRTKIYQSEENRVYCEINHIFFNCENSKVIGHLNRTYQDPSHPGDEKYFKNYAAYIVYDFNALDSIDAYSNSRGMQVSPNCKYFASATGDVTNGVEVYDFNTKELLWKIPVNGPSLTGIEFSPDDKYLVTAPTITIWDIEKQEKVYTYSSGSSNNIALSYDGKYIMNSIGNYTAMWHARWNGNSVIYKPEFLSTIFPNPTTGQAVLKFNLKSSEITTINLTDLNGRIVKPIFEGFLDVGEQLITFETSEIPSGTYLITVRNSQILFSFKLIVNR